MYDGNPLLNAQRVGYVILGLSVEEVQLMNYRHRMCGDARGGGGFGVGSGFDLGFVVVEEEGRTELGVFVLL
jgi:hypothetical protein